MKLPSMSKAVDDESVISDRLEIKEVCSFMESPPVVLHDMN
jgi:hypothetical protein